ncbi:hypothetical protein [Sphingomonas lenta]|uniref:Uncharacterized protein n=1 Tax=Sphingomonas lenta TaxID=1141887 RepID=A0A2A2SD12_9SPHN|nr:hypothetical protein [Sphingomonas lenta]PAX07139.1 hypothetical protein CKY28_13940 [Sphingomonas lenta]
MDTSVRPLAERVAKVLAGQRISINAEGTEESASPQVEQVWREYLPDAIAVLHTLRVPDERMAAAGDVAIWERMVLTALEDSKPQTVVL